MAKKIKWSVQSHKDRKRILQFWIKHNKSKVYSIKLNLLFKHAIQIISKFPKIGKITDIKNVRAKIVRNYYIFYKETKNEIFIISICDAKQDPVNIETKVKKIMS